jgi:aminocarboxymuconate-semialdehyde decarboxylase
VEDVGAGHVMLGTDHPFELRDAEPLASVAAAKLSAAEERAILWGNAAGLLGLA